jgi:hypothetical protein
MSIANTMLDEQAKEPLKDKLNRWLDVLNYWDSDIAECAERINKMGMYHEYEIVQEEMYNLLKGL